MVVRGGRTREDQQADRPAGRRESENEQAVTFDRPGFERCRLTRGGEHATELVLRERFTGGRDDLQCATLGEEQSDLLGAEDLGHGVHHNVRSTSSGRTSTRLARRGRPRLRLLEPGARVDAFQALPMWP